MANFETLAKVLATYLCHPRAARVTSRLLAVVEQPRPEHDVVALEIAVNDPHLSHVKTGQIWGPGKTETGVRRPTHRVKVGQALGDVCCKPQLLSQGELRPVLVRSHGIAQRALIITRRSV